jgi:hypothetical protein
MKSEKRKYVRFLAKDNIFAALRNGFKKIGKVNNISIKGVSFSYLSETSEIDIEGQESQVDIFYGNAFHLFNLPCKIVYDLEGYLLDDTFQIKMSRCGLQFGKLSEMQLDLLNYIITKYTFRMRPIKEYME